MADLVMRKRGALVAGEMGLFIDTEIFSEEFSSIKQGVDVAVEAKQSRNLKQMRLAWGLCRKIADSGALGDADTREVMNYLLKKAKHVKYIANQHRNGVEVEVIVKSIRFASMDQTAFDRLFNRMIYIVTSEILPDVPDGVLRDEIEKMAGVSTPEPKPAPKKRGRPKISPEMRAGAAIYSARLPPPVSIIPADEPVTSPMPDTPLPSETPAPPTPDAVTDEAAQAQLPKNPEQWVRYATDWLTAMISNPAAKANDMMLKWNSELKLRNDCGLTTMDRAPVFELYNKSLESMRHR